MRVYLLFVLLAVGFGISYAQKNQLNDGPYIFIEDQWLVEKKVIEGKVVSNELEKGSIDTTFTVQPSSYTSVEKIAALSDIHGQYDLAVEILQNNEIIDNELNWNFGEGHLVIVGDIFDRGEKVTETLWLIYKLEQQAREAGGNLHYLLGNHEYMVLHNDLRYLHEKYPVVSELLDVSYDELFGINTILGRWLRSKHTILKINEYLFVHGGISQDFLSNAGVNIGEINETMRKSISRTKEEMKASDFYSTYYGSTGPIWYRGYFYDDLPDQEITGILNQVNSEHIVVGHCSNDSIVSLYDNRIFGVDSSIKKGEYGEILFLLDDKYRGTKSGERVKFE